MDIPLLSKITILDNMLALNLKVTLWSAKSKLTPEDFEGVELPPDDIASLGSKRICDPARLSIFTTLKARAFSYLDKHGIRFLGGWAIPEDKAGMVIQELCAIKSEFEQETDKFLACYDEAIDEWLARHPRWRDLISESVVSGEYVRSRLGFSWQLYRVAPAVGLNDPYAMTQSGLQEEIEGLAGNLFTDISKQASEIWQKVYAGKSSVTHKALSPLRMLHQKLVGLTFVEPHVAPVADLIETALACTPKQGHIMGADLLMLQGLVCLLREPENLILHAHSLLEGGTPIDVLRGVANPEHTVKIVPDSLADKTDDFGEPGMDDNPLPSLFMENDAPESPYPVVTLNSFGLW